GTHLTTPVEAVAWLVAVQSQDYTGAKLGLGLRLRGVGDADMDRAFDAGAILRTHVLRPTWHFVAPDDIRWLLALTGPRVHQVNSGMYRQLELDDPTLSRCAALMTRELAGGRPLTRHELKAALEREGISVAGGRDRSGQRLAYIVMWAELEGILGSGPRRGKQFTYMLLDERAPQARTLARDEALAELAGRYFRSRGPATAHDLVKWSGLTVSDARLGLEAVKDGLSREVVDGQEVWFPPATPVRDESPTAYLLSIYDEYFSSYKSSRAIVTAEDAAQLMTMGNALTHIIVLDGRIAGTWRRTFSKGAVGIELNPFRQLTEGERAAIARAAERCGEFFGLAVELS
ncbi:winged helix DNA-binding domain-containing protein, partial [Promineifilum sp.]|uniref:winged helix DNA-binding domain-containing protein n=1 Tax=Promineifilum sp. TaxID=2664178 RepID=UPI0035ADE483